MKGGTMKLNVPTWLRSVAGISLGGVNLLANGTAWPQVALSTGIALFGIITHLSSTSDTSTTTGVKSTPAQPVAGKVSERF